MAPCPSQAGIACVERAEGDVDGDGAVDAVALFYSSSTAHRRGACGSHHGAGRVRRRRDRGGHARRLGHAARLVSVADLDGDERDEVVYVVRVADTSVGGFAGTAGTRALHPVGFDEPTALFGASLELIAGFSCPDLDGDGARELVMGHASFRDGTATLTTQTYRWVGDRLEPDGGRREEDEPADDRRAGQIRSEVRGPRCGGLDEPGL